MNRTVPATVALYLSRAVLAVLWAGLFAGSLSSVGTLSAASDLPGSTVLLLVGYPVIDIVASLVDARVQHAAQRSGAARIQWVNAAISAVAAVAVAFAAIDGPAAVLRVFGAWALLSGLIQFVLGIIRLRQGTGGQWPMILSGAFSCVIGLMFAATAARTDLSLGGLNGYPVGGAIFYVLSALRLHRAAARSAVPTPTGHL